MALVLSEDEYRLVCVVLEEAPMLPADLARLSAVRLRMELADVRALLDGLLDREILALDEETVVPQITWEEAEQTAIDRALTFTPHWPAPNPPPKGEESSLPAADLKKKSEEEQEDPAPLFLRNKPVLWVAGLLLLVGIGAALWLVMTWERYPILTTLDNGCVFIQQTEPQTSAQEAAADYLMEYAREQLWFGTPVFDLFEITAMEEYVTNPGWSAAYSTRQSLSSSFNIAADHEGVVVFVTAEHTVLETLPANPYDNGVHIYRIYLTEEGDGSWSVSGMECSEASLYTQVSSAAFSVDGRDFTVSLIGSRPTPTQCSVYAVVVSEGDFRQLLYLTEVPDTEGLDIDSSRDLNNDGFPDLLIQRTDMDLTVLCYLYTPENASFRLCPELCGTWFSTDPALPGTVQYYDNSLSEDTTSPLCFSRVNGDGTLTELAHMNAAIVPDMTLYSYYLGGNLIETYELSSPTDTAEPTPELVTDTFMSNVLWDELILRAAQENDCLELPQPSYLSSAPIGLSHISLVHWDYENNVAFYTSPSQLLLIRDGTDLYVFPTDAYYWENNTQYADLDGDGDKDLLTVTAWMSYPVILWNGEADWTMELADTGLTFADSPE